MLLLDAGQREPAARIDCSRCRAGRACDQTGRECPKVNFYTFRADDISGLNRESEKRPDGNAGGASVPRFEETTRREFYMHLYGNTTRCRLQNRTLSFFSGEKEDSGRFLFFFSRQGRYYRAFCDGNMTDAALDREMIDYLYPDRKSFSYRGWLCRFSREDGMFHLVPPGAPQDRTAGTGHGEPEASTPAQAIEFIDCY